MGSYTHRSRAERRLVFFVVMLMSVPRLSYSIRILDAVIENMGDNCSAEDIVVDQAQTMPLPDGIPTYTVNILNECLKCSVSKVHLKCGAFSSARDINPAIFRRVAINNCLVKNGKALGPGETVSFQYANTYKYSLTVKSVSC